MACQSSVPPTSRRSESLFGSERDHPVSSTRPRSLSPTSRIITAPGNSTFNDTDQSFTPKAAPKTTCILPSRAGLLPTELLICVFRLVLGEVDSHHSPEAYHRILLVLRLVCRHWAISISAHPAFSTTISLLAPPDLIAYQLKCVREVPVTITCHGYGLFTEDKVRLALTSSRLFSYLDLRHDHVSRLDKVVPRLLRDVNLPSLDRLAIRTDHSEACQEWITFLTNHRPPKLTVFEYDGRCDIPAAILSGAFKGLRSLQIKAYTSPPPTTDQMVALVRDNPLLEALEIVTMTPQRGNDFLPEDTASFVMPRLHHIALRTQGYYPSNGLLKSLLLPKCTKIIAYVNAEDSLTSLSSPLSPPPVLELFYVRLIQALSESHQVKIFSNPMLSVSGYCQWTFETLESNSGTEVSLTVADSSNRQAFSFMKPVLEAAARPISITRLGGSLSLDGIHDLKNLPLLQHLSLDVREDNELWRSLLSSDPELFPELLTIPNLNIHYHINQATGPSAAHALANAFRTHVPHANLGDRLRSKHVQLIGHWWLEGRGEEEIPAKLISSLQQRLRCDTVDVAFEAGDTRPGEPCTP